MKFGVQLNTPFLTVCEVKRVVASNVIIIIMKTPTGPAMTRMGIEIVAL